MGAAEAGTLVWIPAGVSGRPAFMIPKRLPGTPYRSKVFARSRVSGIMAVRVRLFAC
jgi:hypothetical protein